MCLPTDKDELARLMLMNKTMDYVFDLVFKPKPKPEEKDLHDDRPSSFYESDENAGRSVSQIQSGERIPKDRVK